PQAEHQAAGPGQEQGLGEAQVALPVGEPPQPRLATAEGDQLGVEVPPPQDPFGRQPAVVHLLPVRPGSQAGQSVLGTHDRRPAGVGPGPSSRGGGGYAGSPRASRLGRGPRSTRCSRSQANIVPDGAWLTVNRSATPGSPSNGTPAIL